MKNWGFHRTWIHISRRYVRIPPDLWTLYLTVMRISNIIAVVLTKCLHVGVRKWHLEKVPILTWWCGGHLPDQPVDTFRFLRWSAKSGIILAGSYKYWDHHIWTSVKTKVIYWQMNLIQPIWYFLTSITHYTENISEIKLSCKKLHLNSYSLQCISILQLNLAAIWSSITWNNAVIRKEPSTFW